MSGPRRRVERDERGAVTAETAMALPLLVAVTVGLVWLLAVGVAQVRVVDAARETARAAARGDSDAEAVAVGRRVAPDGASLGVSSLGERVEATAAAPVAGPGGIFGFLPTVTVRAEAVAVAEQRDAP
ncbi:TadE family type IV pilus minor pilin [Nocardioides sp. CFH 31398]|uniref:TadE family type IV pilus minor pilin n=1 Tax=Nocardioides sp. CFH 31398 TaxID=2919579 RepID=UPI001F06A7D0|nr:TadE family type IV pilus minor pilin [Nocardioides sp. CFH 31398]MCH1867757.1 pilus assembly protein [Nocardioides sp. CFH 31398]